MKLSAFIDTFKKAYGVWWSADCRRLAACFSLRLLMRRTGKLFSVPCFQNGENNSVTNKKASLTWRRERERRRPSAGVVFGSRMPSILVCRRMGTSGECQADASKFIAADRLMTGGRHSYLAQGGDLQLHATSYRCPEDVAFVRSPPPAASFYKWSRCQMKPEVHQQVTFSNIRPPSKWKYAAA